MAWIRACGGGSPAIPDGKTVTPINDVEIWQKCAGITNPTYTTLAEVLADTGILQTLMASDNAVDYLARSKQFIGNIALVPIMTSNTTPSGEAFGFSIKVDESDYSSITLNNDANAYKAFDGDTNTYPQARVGYDFGKKVAVDKVELVINQQAGVTCTVWASDEKTQNYTKIATFTTTSQLTKETHVINNATAYRYWFVVPVGEGSFRELQFYTADGICQNANAMTYIGQNNCASDTLLADSDWLDAICNSIYYEDVLNAKVPVMTSDTTPSGVCSASSVQSSNYTAYKAFDSAFTGVGWLPLTADGWGNAWVAYMFTTDVKVKRIKLYFYDVYNDGWVTTIKIQGKNTETNLWDDISSNIAFNENTTKVQNINTANSNKKYKQFRLLLVSGSSGMNLGVGNGYNVQFYGREDV